MFLNKDELIKEVFELELFQELKKKFPNEDFESIVIETLSTAFTNNSSAELTNFNLETTESQD